MLPPNYLEEVEKQAVNVYNDLELEIIKQISEEILQGNIEVKPYYNASTKKTPCEYCKYKSICRFDENTKSNEYKYISKLNKDAVLEMIKNKVV